MANETTQGATDKPFKLSRKPAALLNKYLSEIKKGIAAVCEMHTHDSNPSLKKVAFEEAYIEAILGQTVTAVSASIRAMTEGLQAQKVKELHELIGKANQPAEGKEDKS